MSSEHPLVVRQSEGLERLIVVPGRAWLVLARLARFPRFRRVAGLCASVAWLCFARLLLLHVSVSSLAMGVSRA